MNKLKILLIDDDETWLSLYKRKLTKLDHDISTCVSSFEAIQLLRVESFDIAFCDIKMIYENSEGKIIENGGLYLIQEIKELSPQTEVVVVTGYGSTELARESFNEGVFDFIEKGENLFDDIKILIDKILSHRREKQINPNVLASQVKFPTEEKDLSIFETIEFEMNNRWTATDLTAFIKIVNNLYTFFLISQKKNLPKATSSDYQYFNKLWIVIDSGLFETRLNSLKINKIQYSSPGFISFKGLGEPIKELRSLMESLFIMVYKIKREKLRILKLEKELEHFTKNSEQENKKHELLLLKESLEIEEKQINLLNKKIDLFKSLGFDNNQINSVIKPLNHNINQLIILINEDKLKSNEKEA